jgi:hypothetical protein
MQMPVPGPEHRRLFEALSGDFTSDETLFAMAWSPQEQQRHGRTRNRKGLGGLFLVNDYEQLDDGGRVVFHGHGLYGWDPDRLRYTMDWFDSTSFTRAETVLGDWTGDTLRFESPGKSRYEYQILGPDVYEFRIDLSLGGEWKPMMKGTFRRVKA